MTGRAVDTTRLSSEAMNSAMPVMTTAHTARDRVRSAARRPGGAPRRGRREWWPDAGDTRRRTVGVAGTGQAASVGGPGRRRAGRPDAATRAQERPAGPPARRL